MERSRPLTVGTRHLLTKRIVSGMQSGPFALATDGSNDLGSVKLYPMCVNLTVF